MPVSERSRRPVEWQVAQLNRGRGVALGRVRYDQQKQVLFAGKLRRLPARPGINAMSVEDPIVLLKKTPPFNRLDDRFLMYIAGEAEPSFHPRGQIIRHQNESAADNLSIIQSGVVKICIRTNEDEEVLIGRRSAGEWFGMLSIVCGDLSRDTIVAEEDTSCLLIPKETVLHLLRTNAAFSEYILRALLVQLVDVTYREIRNRTLLYGGGDKLLFTNILDDMAAKTVVTASEDVSIREAASIMEARQISSLVLLDPSGLPSGMITDRDIRNKVVAKGRDPGSRVGDIMSVTLIKSDARDYCFEALLKMIRYNIHHLLVVDRGTLKGIITGHDLMMLQGTSPLAVAREIENQDTVDGLVPVSKKINAVITVLIREGAKASTITRLITEINDRLMKRLLEITEARLGPPPVSYCWIVFGSEGRKEQTFKTDQDNAIIYADPEGDVDDADAYFAEFSRRMRDALSRCGFPPCSADYMASNPKWRQPLSVWKTYFSGWIGTPTPEAILSSLIFFDFRPLHGDMLLAERLRAFLGREVRNKNLFLAHMAGVITKNRPPLGLLGGFRLERKGTFNIKINGLCPIIDAARLRALEAGVYATSTVERLSALKDRPISDRSVSDELIQAFEFLTSVRLRHQFLLMQQGTDPDNAFDLRAAGRLEKRLLKESFKLILEVQEAIRRKYGSLVPS